MTDGPSKPAGLAAASRRPAKAPAKAPAKTTAKAPVQAVPDSGA